MLKHRFGYPGLWLMAAVTLLVPSSPQAVVVPQTSHNLSGLVRVDVNIVMANMRQYTCPILRAGYLTDCTDAGFTLFSPSSGCTATNVYSDKPSITKPCKIGLASDPLLPGTATVTLSDPNGCVGFTDTIQGADSQIVFVDAGDNNWLFTAHVPAPGQPEQPAIKWVAAGFTGTDPQWPSNVVTAWAYAVDGSGAKTWMSFALSGALRSSQACLSMPVSELQPNIAGSGSVVG